MPTRYAANDLQRASSLRISAQILLLLSQTIELTARRGVRPAGLQIAAPERIVEDKQEIIEAANGAAINC